MITFLQQAMDRLCITAATASVRAGWKQPGQMERAMELLAKPDFLTPSVPAAQLDFHGSNHFTFTSTYRADWDAPVARGRFQRSRGKWEKHPAILFLHGWNGEMGYYCSFPFLERTLAAQGINALAFELPFHGRRRPNAPGKIYNLISDDLETMVRGIQHCLADALSLRLWLLEQGCPSVSVWGYSLGGWLAGLLAAHPEHLFRLAVLMNPVARMDVAMATLPFAAPARAGWGDTPLELERFSLEKLTPTVEKVLILAGLRDLFVPAETLEDLARHWPNAELWRLRHSHISAVFGAITLWRAIRWVRRNLQ